MRATTKVAPLGEELGERDGCLAAKCGWDSNLFVANTLIGMYSKCGCVAEACAVFSRLTLCLGTLSCSLHSLAMELGFVSDVYVGSTLVDMYASCGRLDRAREVFEKMRQRDAVSWTTMIQGCIDNEEGEMALQLFRRVSSCEDGVLPDGSTYVAALTACAGLAAREVGFQCARMRIRESW
ncbi:pentatricopeptide repeat-containing protein At3g29230-like [Selaginella moellendorffii]|uniref:pentatricopeptide repeat-containing protein At3g29230-like n=1 Tax=Selaginella moellendorffii TaxID=88036 RepID=UPI000D1CC12A|nr:pentatricopeptide repeat-containing protein At3g29230-like [Selaginella moellendorffii]|eukprot:XP_024542739.1 pentatricopeptide repeat-containing protein At3g29230-like [Selaginella moellendorffii]